MSSIFFVAFVAFLILLIKYKWNRRRLEKCLNKLNGPPTIPLLGNALNFMGKPADVYKVVANFSNVYTSPYKLWLGHKPFVIIADPHNIQTVAKKVLDKDLHYKYLNEIFGDNMLISEVEKWKPSRQIYKAALNPTIVLERFFKIFIKANKELVSRLETNANTQQYFDMWPHLYTLSVSMIIQNAFGIEQSVSDQALLDYCNALSKSLKILSQRIYKPWLQSEIIFSIVKYVNGYQKLFDTVLMYPRKLLKMKMDERRSQNRTTTKGNLTDYVFRDFSNILLDQYEEKVIDEQTLNDAVTVMVFAAETTAVTNSFLLLMLAMNPEIQDKVYQEICDTFGDSDQPPTLASLTKLCFMEQCIKETLRLFPTVPVSIRRIIKDFQLNDAIIIPSGVSIGLSIYGMHRSSEIYPNPTIWNPHNFDPIKLAQRPKGSFVPFSAGIRGCVGERYAWASMKVQLSILLRHYKFTTDVRMEDIDLDFDILLRSVKGYRLKLEPRRQK